MIKPPYKELLVTFNPILAHFQTFLFEKTLIVINVFQTTSLFPKLQIGLNDDLDLLLLKT